MFQSAGADSLAQATGLTLLEQDFESALAAIPSGYGEGVYEGLRYGVTVRKSRDGKRTSLFARALAGGRTIVISARSSSVGGNCAAPRPIVWQYFTMPDLRPKWRGRRRKNEPDEAADILTLPF